MTRSQFFLFAALAIVGGMIGGSLIGGLPALAQKTPAHSKTISAEEFRVVDTTGKTRAIIGLFGQISPGLAFYGASKEPLIMLAIDEHDRPLLALSDRKGVVRAKLALLDSGEPSLDLYDHADALRASLALLPDGSPGLALYDRARNARAAMAVMASPEGPSLAFMDKTGRIVWAAAK